MVFLYFSTWEGIAVVTFVVPFKNKDTITIKLPITATPAVSTSYYTAITPFFH